MLANLRSIKLFSLLILLSLFSNRDLSAQCGGAIQLQPVQPAKRIVAPASILPGVVLPPNFILGEDGDPVMVIPEGTEGGVAAPSPEGSGPENAETFKDALSQLNLPPKTVDRVIQAKQQMILDPPTAPEEDAEVGDKIAFLTQLVTASDWQGVASFISKEQDCESCFDQLIQKLALTDESVTPSDILLLLSLRSQAPDKDTLTSLGQLLKKSQSRGNVSHLVRKLSEGLPFIGGADPVARGLACDMLIEAGLHKETLDFMDPLPTDGDAPAELKIRHAVYHVAVAMDPETPELDRRHSLILAAELMLDLFPDSGVDSSQRSRALQGFAELVPMMPAEWKEQWFTTAFTGNNPGRLLVLEVLHRHAQLAKQRNINTADLQKALTTLYELTAALLKDTNSTETRKELMDDVARVFVMEFDRSLNKSGRRNSWIPIADLSRSCPDASWLPEVSPEIRQPLAERSIRILSTQDDPKNALAFVTFSCSDESMDADVLSAALIQSWSQNLDPNRPDENFFERRTVTSSGVFYYPSMMGGQPSAPLTRSKQRRSLRQLAEVLVEFKNLGLRDLDWPGLVSAFTVSHSRAEVYRVEDIEKIFGPVADLNPEISIEISRSLWKRLQRNWRDPNIQKSAGTRRTTKEIQQEVERGYSLGQALLKSAFGKDPSSWEARVVSANLYFDLAEYWRELDPDLERYIPQREAAFANYREASDLYTAQLLAGKQPVDPSLYLQWFTTALGASELSFLTVTTRPENDQVMRILEIFNGLDPLKKSAHLEQFSSGIESAIGNVPADLRSRFVRHAMRIIQDHPAGMGTRRLAMLYEDLEAEVEFHCKVDGGTDVGMDPFGLHLSLRYTDALERESKGFDIYLHNQVYTPLAQQPMDYKDDLESRIREAFSEHFEIVAIQFNDPDFKPFSFNRPGWMEKSFAYVIMKAKDASVDLIPEVRIDLDFEDGTNGSVRIPVVSPVIPIVASVEGTPRPSHGTSKIELTLDDRELENGTLGMEILADGLGVLPPLNQLVPNWKKAFADSGFQLAEVDGFLDNGLNITEMHDELVTSNPMATPIVAKTERSWTLRFERDPSAISSETFQFPEVAENTDRVCKQYTDFDIVTLETPTAELSLINSGGLKAWQVAVGLLLLLLGFKFMRGNPQTVETIDPWKIPETLSGLSLLQYLQKIAQSNRIQDETLSQQLQNDIRTVEAAFFSEGNNTAPQKIDLQKMAEDWKKRVG